MGHKSWDKSAKNVIFHFLQLKWYGTQAPDWGIPNHFVSIKREQKCSRYVCNKLQAVRDLGFDPAPLRVERAVKLCLESVAPFVSAQTLLQRLKMGDQKKAPVYIS